LKLIVLKNTCFRVYRWSVSSRILLLSSSWWQNQLFPDANIQYLYIFTYIHVWI